MLIRLLGFAQFGQKVGEKHVWPHFIWLKGSYETNKGTRNDIPTIPKWSWTELEANLKKQEKLNQGKT
jgi:hypothetical protein